MDRDAEIREKRLIPLRLSSMTCGRNFARATRDLNIIHMVWRRGLDPNLGLNPCCSVCTYKQMRGCFLEVSS